MKKTIIALYLSAFTAFSSSFQSSLELNKYLTSQERSMPECSALGKVYRGTKKLSSNNGFNIRVDASTTLFYDGTRKRNLEYFISDKSTNTFIYILDKDSDGLSVGDYLVLDHRFSDSNFIKITMSYPKRYKFFTTTELFENKELTSRYVVSSERPILSMIILRDLFIEPNIKEYCDKGNIIYFDALSDILKDKFPDRLPLESLRSALKEANPRMQKIKSSKKARELTSLLFDSIAQSFEKKPSFKNGKED